MGSKYGTFENWTYVLMSQSNFQWVQKLDCITKGLAYTTFIKWTELVKSLVIKCSRIQIVNNWDSIWIPTY